MRELALFAGAGGGILASHLLGWRTVCAVENNDYAASVLVQRQNDGILPAFPIWRDIRDFDGRAWRGSVDLISGGFPCQDISVAGKGKGIEGGERSGLWREFARVICEVRPAFVFVENSPVITKRGLDVVLGDLAEMGYDAEWLVLGADEVGAPHVRKRFWLLAYDPYSDSMQRPEHTGEHQGSQKSAGRSHDIVAAGTAMERARQGDVADPDVDGCQAQHVQTREPGKALGEAPERQSGRTGGHEGAVSGARGQEQKGDAENRLIEPAVTRCTWWKAEPAVGRMVNGVADGMEQLQALGNGQVPLVAATAFCVLYRRLFGRAFDVSQGA